MPVTDKKRTFLALTALEQFWDTDAPMVFLGHWCKLYAKKSQWQNLDAIMVDFTALTASHEQDYERLNQIYDEILAHLSLWLNKIHQKNYSLNYWKVLIGPFLYWYIQVIYSRYASLKNAYTLYPQLETIGLAPNDYFTPVNTEEFCALVNHNHAWNLQIFSQIIHLKFEPQISYKKYDWQEEVDKRNTALKPACANKWLKQIQKQLIRCFLKWRTNNVIGLNHLFFGKKNTWRLIFSSKAKVFPMLPFSDTQGKHKLTETYLPDLTLRNEIRQIKSADPLIRLIFDTLPFNMPLNFIENYQAEFHKARRCYPYTVKNVVGYLMQDDTFKFFAAENTEKKGKNITMQHGGGYGASKYHSYSYLEKNNADFFISWGWKDSANVIPADSIAMCKILADRKSLLNLIKPSNTILWVTTEFSPYAHEAASNHTNQAYYQDQISFARALTASVFARVTMRLRHSRWSDNWQFVQEALPDLNMQQPSDGASLVEQILKAQILVVDNLNTVHLYALGLNIPTLIFWDKKISIIRDDAKPYFKALHAAGIYHDSPESAAAMLNKIAEEPLEWWHSELVQAARRYYCDHFAKASEDWLSDWSDLLVAIADGKSSPLSTEADGCHK